MLRYPVIFNLVGINVNIFYGKSIVSFTIMSAEERPHCLFYLTYTCLLYFWFTLHLLFVFFFMLLKGSRLLSTQPLLSWDLFDNILCPIHYPSLLFYFNLNKIISVPVHIILI